MKKNIKILLSKIFSTGNINGDNLIDKYEVISFDIFDTLIFRKVGSPEKIFELIEKNYNKNNDEISGFIKVRKEAEKKARKNTNKEEISINEIYNQMDCFDHNRKKDLLELEIQIEIQQAVVNKAIKKLYNKCKEKNKTILITSDMYLPIETIKEILHKNEIVYDKLYLSSDLLQTKKTGSVYKRIKEDFPGNKILHIGDNPVSDYIMAKINKINSILIGK